MARPEAVFEGGFEGGVFRDGFCRWIRDQRLGFICEIGPRRVEIGPAEVFGVMRAVGFLDLRLGLVG